MLLFGSPMQPLDFFHRANADYLERLRAQYERDPRSLSNEWRAFFAGLQAGSDDLVPHPPVLGEAEQPPDRLTQGAYDLVHSYRELGHCIAKLDPLGHNRPPHPLLSLSESGLSESDLGRPIAAGSFLGPSAGTLRELLAQLTTTYCGTLGVEYMYITNREQRTWLQERMEPALNRPSLSAAESRRVLELLVTAQTFEEFLHAKFIGQKRFSVEGAESLIPLLDTLIEVGAALGAEEVVMGMPHRGRLNVLAHVVHKPYEIIFSEFDKTPPSQTPEGEGDVKYHLGYSHNRVTAQGHKIHCSLSSNPSHLELINPVIEGIARAKQERRGDREHHRVVPILIHGEAAFTGQGIVPETLSLSELPAYRTGGTVHVVVNNQVGFTASPAETRFTPYPTDVAKMIQAPIFHVNGDDPAAVVHAARLAIAFRQQFKEDVLIDLWCYRRHGHNEADDPTFTQPLMYREIEGHSPVAQIYAEQLVGEKRIEADEAKRIKAAARERLNQSLGLARELKPRQRILALGGLWQGLGWAGSDWSARTAVNAEILRQVTSAVARRPASFTPHRKLQRLLDARAAMAAGTKPVDWGCAELWAIGSLLLEGIGVRLTGQDVERGTFSHRHAVLHDFERGTRHVPLEHLAEEQGRFTTVNTMLSELAVLGFEYGFSTADPQTLVMWEAQFGDFANGAQPIIDQFIASAESKWQRMSGIVLLLPHGYEGQGPEHSSARLERFLQLCAQNNLQVCNPTHPAQYFHVLRRQMHRNFRKPLVLLTPKSLLRDERSASPLSDFTEGSFQPVIDDPGEPERNRVRRLVLCSGRVFYTLQAARKQEVHHRLALIRVEQLYPLPREELQAVFARYRRIDEVLWAQEEPRNMGAWSFIEPRLRELLPDNCVLTYQGRDEAASPATGYFGLHELEEKALVEKALGTACKSGQVEQAAKSDGAALKQAARG
jgi:2-oxoglutarate dehydrogenase E1 component